METVYLFSNYDEYPNFEQLQEAQANCRYELVKEKPRTDIKRMKAEVNKIQGNYQVKISITFNEV